MAGWTPHRDVLAAVESLGSATLRGDGEAFEALVLELRARCADVSTSSDLAQQLGQAALRGDATAFGRLEGQLRDLLGTEATFSQPRAAGRPAAASPAAAPPPPPPPTAPVASRAPVPKRAPPQAPDRPGDLLLPEHFVWSEHAFNDGDEGNARVLRGFEEEYAAIVAAKRGDMKDPELLRATLDLATAYVKNYALDKADQMFSKAIDECRERGPPWNIKCLQDLATLRFKQNRQPDCAELLEEVAANSPPHPATQENLGTAYNSMGEHRLALECFEKAVELRGGTPVKEDLWNIAIAKKNLGETHVATPMLEVALARFQSEASECPVTIAKVHDTLAECYLVSGRPEDAVDQYRTAAGLFEEHVGKRSPLFGAAADGLSRSLQAAGRPAESFDALVEALEVQANMDAIHPTPLYELLERAEQLSSATEEAEAEAVRPDLRRLVPAMEASVENLARRGLDTDGNGGVVLQRLGQVFLACGDRAASDGQRTEARRLQQRAAELLKRSRPLMQATTDAGEADLSELCVIAAMQIGLAEARITATA